MVHVRGGLLLGLHRLEQSDRPGQEGFFRDADDRGQGSATD